DALGFEACSAIAPIGPDIVGAVLDAKSTPVALAVVPWASPLDRAWRAGVTLALARGAAWCFLFNGTHLRIVDANRLYSRRFVEFDLHAAMDDDRAFEALWWVARMERFAAPSSDPDGLAAIVASSEQYAAAVSRSLKDGVLAASGDVLGALAGGRRHGAPLESFEQALTIVYR